ncbi:peptidoglycan-binding domain-containing protein [Microcoleus sp. FACHB-672]|uniref:peptidoglycan-binding domain-containing protein n=1 Tax=Microcoleus sp. FACHB-672 TaxID=2692825 RepID=UPI0016875575|nr:peptidoglycan-binding protein [Microcoleus sp. FACHB-672]MBD2043501.1 peptidoglycan-binding protein [Microcoleus sp. FACHB-672]
MQTPINPKATSTATTQAKTTKPVLQRGSKGTAVVELQKLLGHWEIYTDSLDGIFDLPVETAVKAFQHRVFLKEDGIVGAVTWQALYSGAPVNMPVLQRGSLGQSVFTLQRVLHIAGFYVGNLDGNFGLKTEEAVRAFQKYSGLLADGIVGSRTWHALSKKPH